MLVNMPNIATAAISMLVYALSETRMLDLGQTVQDPGNPLGLWKQALARPIPALQVKIAQH
jgi:hypothetical protein